MELPDLDTLKKLIQEVGLSSYEADILAQVRPAIHLDSQAVSSDDDIPLGSSKIGGLPDLPLEWEWENLYGVTLDFIAQINLGELASCFPINELPATGILYFWGDEEFQDNQHSKVIFWDGDVSTLKRYPLPASHYRNQTYKPYRLLFSSLISSLPSPLDYQIAQNLLQNLNLQTDILETLECQYGDLVDKNSSSKDGVYHQIWGNPKSIQGNVFIEAELAHLQKKTPELYSNIVDKWRETDTPWRLLLQLDSIYPYYGGNFCWGDAGRLYFCIQEKYLVARQFENTVCVMQCS